MLRVPRKRPTEQLIETVEANLSRARAGNEWIGIPFDRTWPTAWNYGGVIWNSSESQRLSVNEGHPGT